ncbi:hypothetical protein QM855_03940 [Streptococcus infantis]|jgi:hypothetical protein|uniref:hypothetical protein n=1 Tax=Streptococcus infantis TaxID=68892 RepID=UPI0039C1F4C9
MNKRNLICEIEDSNDLYRVYDLSEDDSNYIRIVSESKKGMYIESTKNVKKILGLDSEK